MSINSGEVQRITTASLFKSLFEEVTGYGGSSCLTSFNIITKGTAVICPNTAQQRTVEKSTAYTVAVPYNCPSSSSTGGYYVSPPSGGTYYTGGGTPTQTGIGGSASTYTTALNTGNNCECKDNCEKVCGNPDEYCIQGKCTKVILKDVKAKVKKWEYATTKHGVIYPMWLPKKWGKNQWVDSTAVVYGRQAEFKSFLKSENCDVEYKWDFGNGITSVSQSTIYTYKNEGVYYPSFTASCKKCGPTKSDQVMVVVGCPQTYADPGKCCVPPGMLIEKDTIINLAMCPNKVARPGYAQGTHHNGCGPDTWYGQFVPNNPFWGTNFLDACNAHDDGYDTCNKPKSETDTKFCRDLEAACNHAYADDFNELENCKIIAAIYCDAVTNKGDSAYENGQKKACICCP